MTRLLLTLALVALTLAVGLSTAVVSSHNHERAADLAKLQRKLEILRATNDQAAAQAAAHVWGRAPGQAPPPAAEEPVPGAGRATQ
jgi:hypothetical protein